MKTNLILSLIFVFAISLFGCQADPENQSSVDNGKAIGGKGKSDSSEIEDIKNKSTKNESVETKPEEMDGSADKSEKSGDKIETIYTTLDEKECKTTDSGDDGYWSIQECPGVAGYKLEVSETDIRQTVNVLAPSGGKYELNFQRNVSSAFSYFGKKAEWRVKKVDGKIQPVALITRFNASEDPEDSSKVTSYLVVTKFEGELICITDIVKPIKNANKKTRELADASAGKPCLKGNS